MILLCRWQMLKLLNLYYQRQYSIEESGQHGRRVTTLLHLETLKQKTRLLRGTWIR